MELDLLVIGSGPSGQRAAIQAAKLGKRVAVAERRDRLGGVSIHTGTIPSKTLRQAVLSHLAQRPLDVLDPTRLEDSERQAVRELLDRTARVVAAEAEGAQRGRRRGGRRGRRRRPVGRRRGPRRRARGLRGDDGVPAAPRHSGARRARPG